VFVKGVIEFACDIAVKLLRSLGVAMEAGLIGNVTQSEA
jgi:hypothetical protein